jgi:hypothetical protein
MSNWRSGLSQKIAHFREIAARLWSVIDTVSRNLLVQRLTRLGLLSCAVCLIVWVYCPSLNRFFADDQLFYFAELNGSRTLSDGLKQYDYTVTRRLYKGDELLFRPLLFTLLAVENTSFGYDYTAWNEANLVLHLVCCAALYLLLASMGSRLFSALFALLFGVMTANCELVVWNHLGGYLLAYAMLTAVFLAARETVNNSQCPRRLLVVFSVCGMIGLFLYELVVPGFLLATAYILLYRRRLGRPLWQPVVAAAVPLSVYAITFASHVQRSHRLGFVDKAQNAGIVRWLTESAMLLLYSAWRAVDPTRSLWTIRAAHRFIEPGVFMRSQPASAAVPFLLMTFAFCVRPGVKRSRLQREWPFSVVLLGTLLAYAGVISLGRPGQVLKISYYAYFFDLLAAALVFTLIDFRKLRRWEQTLATLVLLILIAVNASHTRGVSEQVAARNEATDAYFAWLEDFVELHKAEPDFSLKIINAPPLIDPPFEVPVGFPDRPERTLLLRASDLLFMRYQPTGPEAKYVIDCAWRQKSADGS